MRRFAYIGIRVTVVALALFLSSSNLNAMMKLGAEKKSPVLNTNAATAPNSQNCSHRVGNVFFTITNWGFFGSEFQQGQLTELYCLGPGVTYKELAPSFEFPAGTGVNYLFQGALWIGAIVGDDTLVSVGADGWQTINEMYPEFPPNGGIVQLSSRKTSPYYSPDAISEQDYIAEYTDTLVNDSFTGRDPKDSRSHKPLGLKVIQRSYSWSYSYAQDFILLDYKIVNIGEKDLKKAYMALYIDADCWHPITPNGFADDITGYKFAVKSPSCKDLDDSINIAWIADNDGDAKNGNFVSTSTIAVSGTRVVRSPNPDLQFAFNWWVSNGDATLDWGPRRTENNRDFGTGGLGTPEGDRNKYYIISKREFDYDQLFSGIDYSGQGWLPPPANELGKTLAKGYDTRYLFSFGPFDIAANDTLPFTIAYIAGDHFHTRPDDFTKYFNAADPQIFADKLDFSNFATNALWAGWVYDNPGFDTDNDGYKGNPVYNPCSGDSIYSIGDGVPDFKGPPPPPPPNLRYSASPGRVSVHWNGKGTETSRDAFSGIKDFEGYRVYLSNKLVLSDFALLSSYDYEDYNRYRLNTDYAPARWELTEIPFTLDSLRALYAAGDAHNPPRPNFHPDQYPAPSDSLVWIEADGSSSYFYFTTQDYNRSTLGSAGDGVGVVQKLYPNAQKGDMIWDAELNDSVDSYYEYQFIIDGLLPSKPVYVAVTTFDFGNPATSLAALESSPLANAVQIFPVYSAEAVRNQNLKVSVFPNPYKVNGGYQEAEYEDPTVNIQYARRIHFANLPSQATIRIYTLDGDLVRELNHPCNCPFQEGESMMSWDLISKNTQAVVSGIYLYAIESPSGNQVGKFVIIK